MNRLETCDLTKAIAVRAGTLRERAEATRRKKRDLTVDAIVVSTAVTFSPAVIVTADVEDLELLAAGTDVRVIGIG